MASKPSIAIVGPGRLGSSLAETLVKTAYPLREIIFRNAKKHAYDLARNLHTRAVTLKKARFDADIIWLCVPDALIESTALSLKSHTAWKNKIVFHSSGALASDALHVLRERGASVASVHPLMTFVHGSRPALKGVPFGLEGDQIAVRAARQIIKSLGANAFLVRKQDKALYHAWGTFLSPLALAFMVTAEQLACAIGIAAKDARQKMFLIAMQTLTNYVNLGPSRSFSGPLVRGDTAIVREHLTALRRIPEARETYIVLVKSALRHLPVRNRKKLEKLLRGK